MLLNQTPPTAKLIVREQNLTKWTKTKLHHKIANHITLMPMGRDAGHRQYYRVFKQDTQCDSSMLLKQLKGVPFKQPQKNIKYLLAVDSSPKTENNEAFMKIAKNWKSAGICVPNIYEYNELHGFFLLEDFGNHLLLNTITQNTADLIYRKAFQVIANIQQQTDDTLANYNKPLIHKELNLYPHWFLDKLLCITLNTSEKKALQEIFRLLTETMLEQPQVLIHRDFHSKNLLVCPGPDKEIGVIDFQGAIYGPICYDPVSLLKDCYLHWSEPQINQWQKDFFQLLPIAQTFSPQEISIWFDLTGLQRHLKCLGLFSRLWLKNKRYEYLHHIPNTLNYALQVCQKYPALYDHATWIQHNVLEKLKKKLNNITNSTYGV